MNEKEHLPTTRGFDKWESWERKMQGIARAKQMARLNERDPDMKLYVGLTFSCIAFVMLADNNVIQFVEKLVKSAYYHLL